MRYAVATVVIVAALGLGGFGGYVLHGQRPLNGITILGAGVQSCGTWLETRKSDLVVEGLVAISKVIEGVGLAVVVDPDIKSWVNGYLTGIQDAGFVRPVNDQNTMALTDRQTSDVNARDVWIDNYCQANPLDNLRDAALALYAELASR